MVNIATGIIINQIGIVITNQFRPIFPSSLKAHNTKNPPNSTFGNNIELSSPMSMQLSMCNLNLSPYEK